VNENGDKPLELTENSGPLPGNSVQLAERSWPFPMHVNFFSPKYHVVNPKSIKRTRIELSKFNV
jgi:hypothetical protein